MSRPSNAPAVLGVLGLPAAPGSIYELALTHRSYAFEQVGPIPHNERLEFLGDSVLDLIVTDLIFRNYPDVPEGDMARLRASVVNTRALADLARGLRLGDHILLGKGEEASGGRDKSSLLADTFEALVGAAYVDVGTDRLAEVLGPMFAELLADTRASGGGYDSKTALQELAVRDRGGRPSYRVASSGPDHDKRFIAHVYLQDELFGVGSGRSKKEAEQSAAREALERFEEEDSGRRDALDSFDSEGAALKKGKRDARAS